MEQPTIDVTLGPSRDLPGRSRSRSWVFTTNNPTGPVELSELPGIVYGVYQLEQGESGTPHYQGYLYFANAIRRTGLAKLLPRSYLAPANGSHEQCRDYCTKEPRLDGPFEFGSIPTQGKRLDLIAFRDAIISGQSTRAIILAPDLFPIYARHPNLIDRVRFELSSPRFLQTVPSVLLCLGAPGTGKSHWCRTMYPDAYYKPDEPWWPGYVSQRQVVLDDFNGSHLTFTSFKLLLDKGPFSCQVKGSHVQCSSDEFVITSNYHPHYWYSPTVLGDSGAKAIRRRITRLILFTGIGQIAEIDNPQEWLADDNNAWKYK